jgi:aminoglycoside 6'-N-acetyltransferase
MSDLSFRRLTRADFGPLAAFLAEPHVARWWNHDVDDEALERDFGASADGAEPSEDWLVLLDDRPVGLIQYSKYDDYPDYRTELAPIVDVPPGATSIDYLLGDPQLIGQGIGTRMIREFVDRIWTLEPPVPCIIVPVHSANAASWRALLAAGFHLVARGELDPDNPIDDRGHEILRIDRPGRDLR